MTLHGFILRNALRNKRRLTLTVFSVALSLFLFTVLQTALRELTEPPEIDDAALRLVVRHKVSLANVLPQKYQSRIERIPGVKWCSKFTWFGGIYIDEKNFFSQFACDADCLFNIFTEARVAPEQREAFIKEKTACIVGWKTMQRFGWKLGDKITLLGTAWPCDLELVIRGVYYGGIDETNMFFHHDYLDEALGKWSVTGMFWLRAEDAEVMPELIQRIDKMFANSAAETKTETERAFQLGFLSWFGNVRVLIGSICSVVVFTMILVTASTMGMTIRERAREIAVIKAIGFNSRMVFGLIVAESFGLAITGGLIGCLGAWFLASHLDIYSLTRGFFVKFEVTAQIAATGLLIGAA
ncbi:MAG: FtsX-like permease family protein, partial [Verrucomicrobia bacterium]|nr:FtsX-like permease family protein [Verrucomicrobiota bacterium]